MKSVPFFWVDAFTSRPLAGNPCAVLHLSEALSDETMLAITKEMNLSETAFVQQTGPAAFAARYFTPEREIPLAGHPTIATVHSLVDAGKIREGTRQIELGLRAGTISVDLVKRADGPLQITMTQKRPQFQRTYSAEEIAPVFGLKPSQIREGTPLQTVSTGTPQLMVPVRDHAALKDMRLDRERYEALRRSGDWFSAHLFCLGGATARGDVFARHPGFDPGEDPFTGSATGGMAAYLWHYGLIASPRFTAEQGHWMNRPGQAAVEVVGPREAIESVRVGGTATTLIRGHFELPG